MPYLPLSKIIAGVADRIRAELGGCFKQVLSTQATNAAQLWQVIPPVAGLPAAVVAVASGDYDHDGLRREVRVMIFVIAPFQRGADAGASKVWELCDSVARLFMPFRGGSRDVFGIDFFAEGFTPSESPENVCVGCLTLTGTEFLTE